MFSQPVKVPLKVLLTLLKNFSTYCIIAVQMELFNDLLAKNDETTYLKIMYTHGSIKTLEKCLRCRIFTLQNNQNN